MPQEVLFTQATFTLGSGRCHSVLLTERRSATGMRRCFRRALLLFYSQGGKYFPFFQNLLTNPKILPFNFQSIQPAWNILAINPHTSKVCLKNCGVAKNSKSLKIPTNSTFYIGTLNITTMKSNDRLTEFEEELSHIK